MDIKNIILSFLLSGMLLYSVRAIQQDLVADTIQIRPAYQDDLEAVIDFDRRVSFEFFKPLWIAGYSHVCLGQNPDYYLEKDLDFDSKKFAEVAKVQGDNRLHIAYDVKLNKVVALISFHRENANSLIIDLLMIDAAYRRQGIGSRLVQDALNTFQDVTTYHVYTLKFANDGTHKFYESLGFKRVDLTPIDGISTLTGLRYVDIYFYYRLEKNAIILRDLPSLSLLLNEPRLPIKRLIKRG